MWRMISEKTSKCKRNNNQEFLDEYSECFDKLDSCINKKDKKCVEETYGKILYVKETTNSQYDDGFHTESINCFNLLLQDLIRRGKINLEIVEACIKPCFNQLWANAE